MINILNATRPFSIIPIIILGLLLSSCSSTDNDLHKLITKKWLDRYGDKIAVESIKTINTREIQLGGQHIIEGDFSSTILVKTPIVTDCMISISENVICPSNFGQKSPPLAPGRYVIQTSHTFKKWKSGWEM